MTAIGRAALLVVTVCLCSATVARAESIIEYPPPPRGVVFALADGRSLWFMDYRAPSGARLLRFDRRTQNFAVFSTAHRNLSLPVRLADGDLVLGYSYGGPSDPTGLSVVDVARRSVHDVPTPPSDRPVFGAEVGQLVVAADGSVWGLRKEFVGSRGSPPDFQQDLRTVLMRFDPQTGRVGETLPPEGQTARTLTAGADGSIWYWQQQWTFSPFMVTQASLIRLDPASGERRELVGRPMVNGGLDGASMAFGPDGRLYFATPDGVESFDPATGSTRDVYAAPPYEPEGMPSPSPFGSFVPDARGLWLTSIGRQLSMLDLRTGQLRHYVPPTAAPTRSRSSYRLSRGDSGEIWYVELVSGTFGRITQRGRATVANLSLALRRGFATVIACRSTCTADAQLVRRRRGAARPAVVTVARTHKTIAAGRHPVIRLRFTRRARHQLRRQRSVPLTLITTVRGDGPKRLTRRTVLLRRTSWPKIAHGASGPESR